VGLVSRAVVAEVVAGTFSKWMILAAVGEGESLGARGASFLDFFWVER
jgi:hypothetical protein